MFLTQQLTAFYFKYITFVIFVFILIFWLWMKKHFLNDHFSIKLQNIYVVNELSRMYTVSFCWCHTKIANEKSRWQMKSYNWVLWVLCSLLCNLYYCISILFWTFVQKSIEKVCHTVIEISTIKKKLLQLIEEDYNINFHCNFIAT